MEIIGRITKDAQLDSTRTGKQVVHFDVAVNERFKDKASGEYTSIATFFRCSYWRNAGIAALLKKGDLVQLDGRIGVSAYLTREGKPVGSLTVNVRNITLHTGKKKPASQHDPLVENVTPEDLPF